MDIKQVTRPRLMYRMEDFTGNIIPHQGFEAVILETVQNAVPGKEVSFREKDFLIDMLTEEERLALEEAVSASPELSGRKLVFFNMVFCESNGVPIKGKDRLWELAEEQSRINHEAFVAKYGADADEDDYVDW